MPASAKKIQVSIDGGSTYFTLPGDTGDLALTSVELTDTVFGQLYQSHQPGLVSWTISANGIYKGFAGYVAVLKASGTSTTMTNEAAALVSGKTYQITNTAHRVIDPAVAIVIKDNAVTVAASNIVSIDYLNGLVTFTAGYTPTTPITFTGNYLPMTAIAKGQKYTLGMTTTTIDKSDFPGVQANSGLKIFDYGLKMVSFDMSGFYAVSSGWRAALLNRGLYVIEIGPDGGGLSIARGIFKLNSEQQSGKVGELEVEAIKFTLFVPDPGGLAPLMLYPFQWYQNVGTTLSTAVQNAITAWQANTLPFVKYLYDGTNGVSGATVITDLSLSGGLEEMGVFAMKFQGSDTLTTVGTG